MHASLSPRPPVFAGLALALAAVSAPAQQLAIRNYGPAEGLANSRVNCVGQDSKGYLWIGTWEGLSRFDGYRFTNYGVADGLGSVFVNCVATDRRGRLWVGTNGGGLARLLEPRPASAASDVGGVAGAAGRKPVFASFRVAEVPAANNVDEILFDGEGLPWVFTDYGAYRSREGQDGALAFELVVQGHPTGLNASRAACLDRQGALWFGCGLGLARVLGGRVEQIPPPEPSSERGIVHLLEDRDGNLLAAYPGSIYARKPSADGGMAWTQIPIALTGGQEIRYLAVEDGGALWVATTGGLIRLDGGRQQTLTTANGLSDEFVRMLFRDRDDNLWLATNGAGISKLAGMAWSSYTRAQGLTDHNVFRIVEDQGGRIFASSERGGIVRIEDGRAEPLPLSQEPPFDRVSARIAQDAQGHWWLGAESGLFFVEGPELDLRRARRVGPDEGFSSQAIAGGPSIDRDCEGRVWVSATDPSQICRLAAARDESGRTVARVDRTVQGFEIPVPRFRVLKSGSVWIGGTESMLRSQERRLLPVEVSPGLPETLARAFFEDSRGWLWIGLRLGGVSVTRDPSATPLAFENYSTAAGLASASVWAIQEDDQGRMYLGTGRGLDRLDPRTGEVRHYGSADGLAADLVNCLTLDRRGDLWIGTAGGVSHLRPRAERESLARPPIYVTRVRVAGGDLPLPETGARAVDAGELAATSNDVRIEFVGLSFRGERELEYQYRLEGADPHWTEPSRSSQVDFASLSPGRYRFSARAIDRSRLVSETPAEVLFEILPPVWKRAWFLATASAALAALALAGHRARVSRAVALERIRRQIALDLHDDIGSGLAQIAIASEVAKREPAQDIAARLDEIAGLARGMRDSMGDIVWSVDPRKDHVSDLVHRMRQVAYHVLQGEGLRVDFTAPEDAQIENIALPPDRRRHLLLIFKEAVTNIAKHAQATSVAIAIVLEGASLELTIRDDGRGFDTGGSYDGHGLVSLRQRARELGARFDLRSGAGGTTVSVRVDGVR
jgi:signal transduction histidine kinase/ligand-binding sensor domain-containing protein